MENEKKVYVLPEFDGGNVPVTEAVGMTEKRPAVYSSRNDTGDFANRYCL